MAHQSECKIEYEGKKRFYHYNGKRILVKQFVEEEGKSKAEPGKKRL